METGQKTSNESQEKPRLCVDLLIDMGAGLVLLIKRKNEPQGWALPGGFVEAGESVEEAAMREAKEETDLDVELVRQFHCYSNPSRDPRGHVVSIVYVARGHGLAHAGSDAEECELFHEMNLPSDLAFDHREILKDYFQNRY